MTIKPIGGGDDRRSYEGGAARRCRDRTSGARAGALAGHAIGTSDIPGYRR